MSNYYGAAHRALQDEFDTRRLADLMEGGVIHTEFAPHEIDFIQSRDMFFLATIDQSGRPTVSYKGGATGFVRVTAPSALIFPWYDGNGMFYSAGNFVERASVGLLFIDFLRPNRLRVQGAAAISRDPALLATYPGAQFLVSVAVESVWVNCPRYIHGYQKVTDFEIFAGFSRRGAAAGLEAARSCPGGVDAQGSRRRRCGRRRHRSGRLWRTHREGRRVSSHRTRR